MAPSTSNNNDDFFYEIYLQHPSSKFKSVKQFRAYHPTIKDSVMRIINQQPMEKINEAKKEAIKQTLALINARHDKFAYPKEKIKYYCNQLPDNWLFRGGFFEKKLEFYCPCSPGQSRWRENTQYCVISRR